MLLSMMTKNRGAIDIIEIKKKTKFRRENKFICFFKILFSYYKTKCIHSVRRKKGKYNKEKVQKLPKTTF